MVTTQHPRLRVLIAHREPLIAAGVTFALQPEPGLELQQLMPASEHMLSADVVITDYVDGMKLLVAFRARGRTPSSRGPRLMFITDQDREHEVRQALEAGVHGYVLTNCQTDELARCVRSLGAGARYMSMVVAQRVAESMTREALTPREVDVIRLVARGQCNKAIAQTLDIALGTVKAHVKSIMGKLDARSRTHAVSVANGRGLIEKDEDVATSIPEGRTPNISSDLLFERLAA